MDEQALQDAYNVFVKSGYSGTLEQYKDLVSSNTDALTDSHRVFSEAGYSGDINHFSELIGVKKKDTTDSSSETISTDGEETIVDSPSVSEEQPSTKGQLLQDLEAGKFDEQLEETPPADDTLSQLLNTYNEKIVASTSITAEDEELIANEQKGEFGILDKMQKYYSAFTLANPVLPDYIRERPDNELKNKIRKDIAVEENINIKDVKLEDIEARYADARKEELVEEKKASATEEFIEDLPAEDKLKLENHFKIKSGELLAETWSILFDNENIDREVNNIYNQLSEIEKRHNSFNVYPESYHDNNLQLFNRAKELSEQYEKNLDKLGSKEEDLMSVQKEVDLFKRNYNKLVNVGTRIGIAGVNLALNLAEINDKVNPSHLLVNEITKGLGFDFLAKNEEDRNKLREKMNNMTEGLRKNKSLDDIHTGEDLTEWALDLFSEQTPNTILMATTGGASLALLGASSAGAKFHQLEEEEIADPDVNYSTLEKYTASLFTGLAEGLSEKISLGQINKAKRAFKTIGKKELKETTTDWLKKNLTRANAWEFITDVTQEGTSEVVAQLSENVVDKYMLGKDVSLNNGLTDAFVSGAFMSAGMFKAPVIVANLTKPFIPKDTNQKMGENFNAITNITRELTAPVNKQVEKTLKAKRQSLLNQNESLLRKVFKDVDKLSPESKQKLINIENQKYQFRKDIQALKVESNLNDKLKQGLVNDILQGIEDLDNQKNELLTKKEQDGSNKKKETNKEGETKSETTKENVTVDVRGKETTTPSRRNQVDRAEVSEVQEEVGSQERTTQEKDLTTEQKTENKPRLKMRFVTKSELTKAKNLDKVVKENTLIKEEYKELRKLIDCLWK